MTTGPWTGECRCGRLGFDIGAPPLMTMACHCAGCQRMAASAFSLSALVPAARFTVTRGETAIGGLHGATQHLFCPHCMSWVLSRPAGRDEVVTVRSNLLDDRRWTEPFIETWTRTRLPWASTPARHGFPEFPPPDQIGALIAEFADRYRT